MGRKYGVSHIWGEKNPERIEPKFCLMVDVCDVITLFKFGDDRLNGLGSAEGQSSPVPVDFDGRPYNTLTLPCEQHLAYLRGARLAPPAFKLIGKQLTKEKK